jgi:GTPase SAR1 family protein
MGQLCCRSERSNNHAPDEHAQKPAKTKSGELVRIFMTGLGSAGKTTIVRQLHLLCNKNSNYRLCNEDWAEIKSKDLDTSIWAVTIRRNILDTFDIFLKQLEVESQRLSSAANFEFAKEVKQISEEGEEGIESLNITETFRENLIRLFQDEAIKGAYKRRNRINVEGKKLFDGCDYFLTESKIREVFDESYIASDEDKVHSRNPTVDMHTYRFKINQTRVEIADVGGQRSELMKIVDYLRHWSFGSTEGNRNFILLVVSMSDYNAKHEEYEGTLLDECVEYMKVLLNNKVAQNCGLLIFFNKKDRFKEKLQDEECREDISYLAPFMDAKQVSEYLNKGKFDEGKMSKAIANKFTEALKEIKNRQKSTYSRLVWLWMANLYN